MYRTPEEGLRWLEAVLGGALGWVERLEAVALGASSGWNHFLHRPVALAHSLCPPQWVKASARS